jgi:hypothetical protein
MLSTKNYIVGHFLVAEQLYTQPCVCVGLSDVCLMSVPRFVCPFLRTPGSDQLYSGVQTDDQVTI